MSTTMNENDDGGKWTFVARGERSGNPSGGAGGGWRSSEPMTRTGLGRTASSSGSWGERSEASGGWGGRAMPAAFGGAERDKRNERLEEQRRRAADEAERQRREAREREEAERDRARRMDITNEEEFPALGGAKRPALAKSKPALDFRAAGERGAVLGAIQEAEAAAAAREHEFAAFVARMEAEERAAHRRRLANITTHCYDDGFNEFEPPDEDEGYGGGSVDDGDEMPAHEDDEEDGAAGGAGEFNSHLAVLRRRGDKSDW